MENMQSEMCKVAENVLKAHEIAYNKKEGEHYITLMFDPREWNAWVEIGNENVKIYADFIILECLADLRASFKQFGLEKSEWCGSINTLSKETTLEEDMTNAIEQVLEQHNENVTVQDIERSGKVITIVLTN